MLRSLAACPPPALWVVYVQVHIRKESKLAKQASSRFSSGQQPDAVNTVVEPLIVQTPRRPVKKSAGHGLRNVTHVTRLGIWHQSAKVK